MIHTLVLSQFTFMGEVEKKSLILRLGFALTCVSLLPPCVLSLAFSPFFTVLVAVLFEFKSKHSLNGWLWLTR